MIDKIISDLEGRSQEHTDTRPRQKDIKGYKIWLKDMMAGVRWAKIIQSVSEGKRQREAWGGNIKDDTYK